MQVDQAGNLQYTSLQLTFMSHQGFKCHSRNQPGFSSEDKYLTYS